MPQHKSVHRQQNSYGTWVLCGLGVQVCLIGGLLAWGQVARLSGADSTDNAGDTANASASPKAALAAHLSSSNVKLYGTYWCPSCTTQKNLFGSDAFSKLNYVECDPRGKNPQVQLCNQANIRTIPTWEINGRKHIGVLSLDELADMTNYSGPRNF